MSARRKRPGSDRRRKAHHADRVAAERQSADKPDTQDSRRGGNGQARSRGDAPCRQSGRRGALDGGNGDGKTVAQKAVGHLREAVDTMRQGQYSQNPAMFRRGARDVATILRFYKGDGRAILSEAEADGLIRAAAVMAGKAAKNEDHDHWGPHMKVIIQLARLEQQDVPSRSEHLHVHAHAELSNDEKAKRIEESLRREAIRRGLIREGEDLCGGNGKPK